MSYIEKTARKLYPILNELKKRMVPEKKKVVQSASQPNRRSSNKNQQKKHENANVLKLDAVIKELDSEEDDQLFIDLSSERTGMGKQNTDMKNILGYLN